MTISATMIADSISQAGVRISTMQLRYPRFIHAEFMTHRDFSRNASSSRAIPVEKMIEDIMRDPAMPVKWGKNQKGMQADEDFTGDDVGRLEETWLTARNAAVDYARRLMADGLHKQLANRILEPWAHINVVVTSTRWNNFWTLRRHKDAQPEMYALAEAMAEARIRSRPQHLGHQQWHLPYVRQEELSRFAPEELPKLSAARCARVSYLHHDGTPPSREDDLALFDRLMGAQPLHASPAEHQATPDKMLNVMGRQEWQRPELWGNFHGWIQHRKTLSGERVGD